MSESIPPVGTVVFAWEPFGLNYTCFRTSRYEAPAHTLGATVITEQKKNRTAGALRLQLSCQLRLLRVLSPFLLTSLALEGRQQDVRVLCVREGYTSHAKSMICCVDFFDRPCPLRLNRHVSSDAEAPAQFHQCFRISEGGPPCPTSSTDQSTHFKALRSSEPSKAGTDSCILV